MVVGRARATIWNLFSGRRDSKYRIVAIVGVVVAVAAVAAVAAITPDITSILPETTVQAVFALALRTIAHCCRVGHSEAFNFVVVVR